MRRAAHLLQCARSRSFHELVILVLSLTSWADLAHAQATPLNLRMSTEMRFDPARIKGGEKLGLMSTALMFEPSYGWLLGPAVVGAATGERGGFFVLGGQIERRWRSTDHWQARLALLAGGGGGGGAPVGGGLLIQPSASLLYDWGGWQTGLSWSRVSMPSGRIGSQQLGVVLSWDGHFRYFESLDVGQSSREPGRTGFGMDRLMLSSAALKVQARAGHPASSQHLVGVRAERRVDDNFYWGVETAAATHGGADGYMEVLGSAGWELPLSLLGLDAVHVGVRGAAGLGGGGAVETGGGTLAKAAGTLRWDWGRYAFVGVEAGAVRSGHGDYRAHYAQWQLGWQLDHPDAPGDTTVTGLAWSASLQHVLHAQRKDGRQQALDTVGVKLQRQLGEQFYVTGQAHSAFAGQAGAYSVGLVGGGWQTTLGDKWRVAGEVMAGAAGGGGVATQGGAVAQGMAYLGRVMGEGSQLQIGAGRIRSQHGGLNSPVIDISWTQSFGVGQR